MNLKPTSIVISHCLHGNDFADLSSPSTPREAIKALGIPEQMGDCHLWNVEIIHYAVAMVQDKTKYQYEIKAYYQ